VLKCVRYKLKRDGIRHYPSLAEDITQDMFLMLWESDRLSSVRNKSSIQGWLAIVAINFTAALLKTKNLRKERKTLSLDACLNGEKDLCLLSGLSSAHSVGENILSASPRDNCSENRDLHELVAKEITKLVPKQALALRLNLLEGLAQKDIAELLKIPDNTVATLIRRGKSRLAQRLKTLL